MATDVWPMIHAERSAFAETLTGLSPDQWDAPSLCKGWRVRDVVGHMISTGNTTPGSFFGGMIGSGFRFNSMVDKQVKREAAASPEEMVARFKETVNKTNHPPGPTIAMLGEVVMHGEDVRRPLGISANHTEEALQTVANFYMKSNLLIGAKKRSAGLALKAADIDWSTGSGPEVSGPAMALLVTLTGRRGAEGELSGPGVPTLVSRL
jgi:uncharacterized protein (TIGR03083 family)